MCQHLVVEYTISIENLCQYLVGQYTVRHQEYEPVSSCTLRDETSDIYATM